MDNLRAWFELNEHFRADDDGLAVSEIHELARQRLWDRFDSDDGVKIAATSEALLPSYGDPQIAITKAAVSLPVELISTGGRYPGNLARYCVADIRATLQVVDGKIFVRVDDLRNIDRWEELVGDLRDVLAELRKHGGDDAAKQ